MSELTQFPLTTAAQMTAADWTAKNPVLEQFQMGVESDTGKTKVCMGPRTAWNSLDYWSPGGEAIQSAVLEADFPKTNDTFANVTDLTLNLEAGHWYRVTMDVVVGVGLGLFKLGLGGGTATFTGYQGTGFGYNADDGSVVGFNVGDITEILTGYGADGAAFSFTAGIVLQVNVGGTIIGQFAQSTTDAAASTLRKYAAIQAVDITPE